VVGGRPLPQPVESREHPSRGAPMTGEGQVHGTKHNLPHAIRAVDVNLTGFVVLLVFDFIVYS
jgi:hypothetical protein